MPWSSNADLPDSIKALPAEAQSIWRKAANGALSSGKDEEAAVRIGWTAVKNAGFKKSGEKWVKMETQLDLFGKLYELDIEVFSTGKWNGDKYTDADLDNMVENFSLLQNEVKPPVKLGHNDKQIKDGQPALGWVKGIKKVGSKLIATITQVPEVVYKSIKAGRYKRVSSEIYWNYKSVKGNVFKRVLSAVALLGADIPAVTDLADLEVYLSEIPEDRYEALKICTADIAIKQQDSNNNNDDKGDLKMSDETKKLYEEKLAQQKKDFEAKIESERKEREKLEETLKKNAANELKRKREKHETELKTLTEKLVKDGKMLPAYRDNMLKDYSKLPYDPESGFALPIEFFKTFVEDHKIILDKKEYGNHDQNADDLDLEADNYQLASRQIDKLVKEYQRSNPKTDYDTALDIIISDPKHKKVVDLYFKYSTD